MRTVCIDTHICIWGLKEEATEGQETMIPRAKEFFRSLEKEGARVVIPAVVIFELLMPMEADSHTLFASRLQAGYMISPFDLEASMRAARVWHSKQSSGLIESIRAEGVRRSHVKIDCQIIGTALAKGASCIYTYDEPLRRLAAGFIDAREMDNEPTLFSS